jgi:hypothetical protein
MPPALLQIVASKVSVDKASRGEKTKAKGRTEG